MSGMHEIEIATERLPRPARVPGWREMLADRRAVRAKLPGWEARAESYARELELLRERAMRVAAVGENATPTFRPRGRK